MEEARRADNGITAGVLWKQLLLYFFPVLAGSFFQQMYTTVDAIVVGRFAGSLALAAVGCCNPFANLLFGFFVALASGATVVISQDYGSGSAEAVRHTLHTGMAMALLGGAIVMALGMAAAAPVLQWMGVPADVRPGAALYLRVFFAGMIPAMVYNVGAGMLRAVGDSRRPTRYLMVCGAVNVALDVILVAVADMGVLGVALATVLAEAVSAALVVRALMRRGDACRLQPARVRLHGRKLVQILRVGVPSGLQSIVYAVVSMVVMTAISGFGSTALAAWTAFGKMDAIVWLVMGAFGTTVTTFVAQNFGAGQYDRMRRSVRLCMAMALGATLALSALICLFGRPLLGLFTRDAAVVDTGYGILFTMSPFYALYVAAELLSGALRGCGDVVPPTVFSLSFVVMQALWVLTVVRMYPSLWLLSVSYPLSWALAAGYYLRGGWLKRRIAARAAEEQ